VWAVALVALGLGFLYVGREISGNLFRIYRGWRLIRGAKLYGSPFRYNKRNGVTCICTEDALNRSLDEYFVRAERGEVDGTAPVVVKVLPSYIFADNEESRRPVHTGTWSDLLEILRKILEKDIGIKRSEVDEGHFRAACYELMERDSRIYVPYCSSRGNPEEKETFGRQSFDAACDAMLEAVV
jgi:hypothetical protein